MRVPDRHLSEAWRSTADQLEEARHSLTDPDDSDLALYRDFLDHNELGLAFDVLVDVADTQRAPHDVWKALAAAAETMQLDKTDAVHGPAVRRMTEHLTASHEWFELRALLNEWDPIGIYDPATNSPPDEYDCMYAPLMLRLRRGDTADEIANYLVVELREHFGLDPRPSRPHDCARRLATWFESRTR